MAKKKVFISFDYDEDKRYKHLLAAWDSNSNFEFNFSDQSVTVTINSVQASVVKAGITKKMQKANYLLVIVGKKTYGSEWCKWEIEKAKELGLKLVAVKIDRTYISPSGLLNSGTKWAMSFTQEAVINALKNC